MQVISVTGRVGQDPEIKYLASGMAVANFSIASSDPGTGGERHTEWFRCIAWDKSAELIAKSVKSGHRFTVTGRMKTHDWEDKQGVKRYTTELIVNTWEFMEPKGASSNPQSDAPPVDDFDDDIPF